MFRFTIRDALWLMVALGIALAWRLEIRQRQWEAAELKRLQTVLREQAMDLDRAEHYSLDKNDEEARPLLADWAQRRAAKRVANAAKGGSDGPLVGQWEVVELIDQGMVRDLTGQPEWIKIERGRITFVRQNGEPDFTLRCAINAREIDLDASDPFSNGKDVIKGLYQLKNDELRIVWQYDFNKPRPTDFDALKDKQLTLCVLKKVK